MPVQLSTLRIDGGANTPGSLPLQRMPAPIRCAFGMSMLVKEDGLTVTGLTKQFTRIADSGRSLGVPRGSAVRLVPSHRRFWVGVPSGKQYEHDASERPADQAVPPKGAISISVSAPASTPTLILAPIR